MQRQPLETDEPMTQPTTLQLRDSAPVDIQLDVPSFPVLETAVDRLEGDKQLLLELGLHRFQGRPWELFASALAEYGFAVLRAWIANGKIFDECHRKGRSLPRSHLELNSDDVLELAGHATAEAIAHFRNHVLIPGVWNPERGASLRTFFIGQCVLQFPNVYRAWVKEQCARPLPDGFAEVSAAHAPAASIEAKAQLSREIESAKPRSAVRILAAMEAGYSHDEIAQELNITVPSLQARLYRHRNRADREAL